MVTVGMCMYNCVAACVAACCSMLQHVAVIVMRARIWIETVGMCIVGWHVYWSNYVAACVAVWVAVYVEVRCGVW